MDEVINENPAITGHKSIIVGYRTVYDEDLCEYVKQNMYDVEEWGIVADDFSCVPVGYCRCCKQKIPNKYSKVYAREHIEYFTKLKILYSYKNGYCEECAKKQGKIKKYIDTPFIVEETYQQLVGDKYPTVRHFYSDGGIVESNPMFATRGIGHY